MAHRILVIEDQDDFRELLRMTLDFKGFDVTTAANGAEGLKATVSEEFDLITSDIEMPVMNGIEFVRQYRAAGNASTPIIMLSAAGSGLTKEALGAGATDVVEKPFEPIKLTEMIDQLLA